MELPSIFIGRKLSLITRKWLESEQIRFIEQPLIRINYKRPELAFFKSFGDEPKRWVVTSSYAAYWVLRFADKIGLHKNDKVYCLSERQQSILKECNVQAIRPDSPSASSLAELLVQEDEGLQVIYLRGNKSLNHLPEQLTANNIDWQAVEVYQNTSIEIFLNEVFDGYLFFSPSGIESYKQAGNFPEPKADIVAIGNTTAQAAWKEFPNKVLVSPEQEELSFVKYAIQRIKDKLNEPETNRKVIRE